MSEMLMPLIQQAASDVRLMFTTQILGWDKAVAELVRVRTSCYRTFAISPLIRSLTGFGYSSFSSVAFSGSFFQPKREAKSVGVRVMLLPSSSWAT